MGPQDIPHNLELRRFGQWFSRKSRLEVKMLSIRSDPCVSLRVSSPPMKVGSYCY